LTSIAALVIGGTALSGGVGGAGGAVAGAIVLGLISNIVFFAGLSGGMRELIDGAIVIGALALANIPALRRARS
jgi:ribose transport system permease protein